jgi:hypothetical protein
MGESALETGASVAHSEICQRSIEQTFFAIRCKEHFPMAGNRTASSATQLTKNG